MDNNNQPTQTPREVPLEVPADSAVNQVAPQPAIPKKRSRKVAIILMAWPACAIILVIVLYALVNYLGVLLTPEPTSGALFGSTPPVVTIISSILFIIGGLAVGLGPISFIVGLILLIVRSNKN